VRNGIDCAMVRSTAAAVFRSLVAMSPNQWVAAPRIPLKGRFQAASRGGVSIEFFVDPMLGSAFRVDYSDTLPAIDITNNEEFDALVATGLVKRTDWRNEGEYRLIFRNPPLPSDPPLIDQKLCFPRSVLTRVISAIRCPRNAGTSCYN
jgi:hypothetical protein